jgi:hypothetical protein
VLDGTIVRNGNVIVDSEVMVVISSTTTILFTSTSRGSNGTTATTHTTGTTVTPWVRPGDTITVGTGAGAETTTVSSVAGATITVPALTKAHTSGDEVTTGIQDTDVTATLNPAIASVVSEFASSSIFTVDLEPGIFPTGAKDAAGYLGDGLHFTDEGHQRLATRFLNVVTPKMTQYSALARPVVTDRRSYYDTLYAQITFLNSWSNYATGLAALSLTGPQSLGYTKDFVTGRVRIKGAIKNTSVANSALSIFQLPTGFRPIYDEEWVAATNQGPQVVRIQADGNVLFPAGLTDVSYVTVNVIFEAEQ